MCVTVVDTPLLKLTCFSVDYVDNQSMLALKLCLSSPHLVSILILCCSGGDGRRP